MGTNTNNLKLFKYGYSDTADIKQMNDNMDILDNAHKKLEDSIGNVDKAKAPLNHNHTKANITDFAHTHTKNEVSDFAHTHTRSNITDFSHTHNKADISDFAHTHEVSSITDIASGNILRPNGKSIENALVTNEASIDATNKNLSTLTTKVNNGQNHKLTNDNGMCEGVPSLDLNNISKCGFYMGSNMLNSPNNDPQWFYIEALVHNELHQVQKVTELAQVNPKMYIRSKSGGSWNPWREL